MKRRDFLLVRDVVRRADYLTLTQQRSLAEDFAEAIAVQPGTDPMFNRAKFVHEITRSGADRKPEPREDSPTATTPTHTSPSFSNREH